MRISFEIARSSKVDDAIKKRAIPVSPLSGRGGWWNIVSEPFLGAWQQGEEMRVDTVLTHAAVFACVSLIASDVAKCGIKLTQLNASTGVWLETTSNAFSPVLRRPNHFQNWFQFATVYITSKLIHGNVYVLKRRDGRGVVNALYILDPTRVRPMVAIDGSVFYELKRDDLSNLPTDLVMVPAREIIHDLMNPLYHPLCGVSPIYACGVGALQGLKIQANSSKFFANGQQPSGVLTAPGEISQETADRLKTHWDTNYSGDNVGKVAVLGDGLKYEVMSANAVDSQLIEQLQWTGENVCTAYRVPRYMVGIGAEPNYNNVEALRLQYYSQRIQELVEAMEWAIDDGLDLPADLGVEIDVDALLRLDLASRTKAAADSIGSGAMSPDEARLKFFGLGPVPGGDSPYLQQQYFSLAALAARDAAGPPSSGAAAAQTSTPDANALDAATLMSYRVSTFKQMSEAGLYAQS